MHLTLPSDTKVGWPLPCWSYFRKHKKHTSVCIFYNFMTPRWLTYLILPFMEIILLWIHIKTVPWWHYLIDFIIPSGNSRYILYIEDESTKDESSSFGRGKDVWFMSIIYDATYLSVLMMVRIRWIDSLYQTWLVQDCICILQMLFISIFAYSLVTVRKAYLFSTKILFTKVYNKHMQIWIILFVFA